MRLQVLVGDFSPALGLFLPTFPPSIAFLNSPLSFCGAGPLIAGQLVRSEGLA